MKDWINLSDREPDASDSPLWIRRNGETHFWESGLPKKCIHSDVTHWRSAKGDVPEPPIELLTQQEKDQFAAETWTRIDEGKNSAGDNTIYICDPRRAFIAGMAHRDAANKQDLQHVIQWTFTAPNPHQERHHEALNKLRARAGIIT